MPSTHRFEVQGLVLAISDGKDEVIVADEGQNEAAEIVRITIEIDQDLLLERNDLTSCSKPQKYIRIDLDLRDSIKRRTKR